MAFDLVPRSAHRLPEVDDQSRSGGPRCSSVHDEGWVSHPPMDQQLSPCQRQSAAASRSPRPVPLPTGHTFDEVETIGDLDGLGSTLCCRSGIQARSITTDDRELGMIIQPGRRRGSIAVREQVRDPVALQIDQQRAVAAALPPGPVIDAQEVRVPSIEERCCTDNPEQRVWACRHAELGSQTGSRFTTCRECDVLERLTQADAASTVRIRDVQKALGEEPPRTRCCEAAESTDLNDQDDLLPGDGEVGNRAPITRVDPR